MGKEKKHNSNRSDGDEERDEAIRKKMENEYKGDGKVMSKQSLENRTRTAHLQFPLPESRFIHHFPLVLGTPSCIHNSVPMLISHRYLFNDR